MLAMQVDSVQTAEQVDLNQNVFPSVPSDLFVYDIEPPRADPGRNQAFMSGAIATSPPPPKYQEARLEKGSRFRNLLRGATKADRWKNNHLGLEQHNRLDNALARKRAHAKDDQQATDSARGKQQVRSKTIERNRRVVQRLLQVKWTPIDKVEETAEGFNGQEDAEKRFRMFQSFMDFEGTTLGLPDGISVHIERVLIREPGCQPAPYIRLTGFPNEDTVKSYHSILAKRKVREQYHPPLRLCYEIQRLGTSFLAAKPDGYLVGDQPLETLCGRLAKIGTDQKRRVVTIGGVVQVRGALRAITSGHLCYPPSGVGGLNAEPFHEGMIDPRQYGDDVESALILEKREGRTEDSSREVSAPVGVPSSSRHEIGEIELYGDDWSLITLQNPTLAFPNMFRVMSEVIYLTVAAQRPISGQVTVLAGVSGFRSLQMSPGPVSFALPSGRRILTWKLIYGDGTPLRQGDSGSWVVQPETGKVFGHIIASTESYAFMVPLTAVVDQLNAEKAESVSQPEACLPPIFDCLVELAKHCHRSGLRKQSSKYANEAIKEHVIRQSQGSDTAKIVGEFFVSRSRNEDTERFMSAMLQRTGVDIIARLVELRSMKTLESQHISIDVPTLERAQEYMSYLSKAAGLDWHKQPDIQSPTASSIPVRQPQLTGESRAATSNVQHGEETTILGANDLGYSDRADLHNLPAKQAGDHTADGDIQDIRTDTGPQRLKTFAESKSPPALDTEPWKRDGPTAGRTRINVSLVTYLDSYNITTSRCNICASVNEFGTIESLKTELGKPAKDIRARLKLYIVEDVSWSVFELLRSQYGIDAALFQDHVLDTSKDVSASSNYIQDVHRPISFLRGRDWCRFMFPRARVFMDEDAWRKAEKEISMFNVVREMNRNGNSDKFWGVALTNPMPAVGFINSKATIWMRQAEAPDEPIIGLLLLDPTVETGHPLRAALGYQNGSLPSGMDQTIPAKCGLDYQLGNFFQDIVHYASRPQEWMSHPQEPMLPTDAPLQALLHTILTQWPIIIGYINSDIHLIEEDLHLIMCHERFDRVVAKLYSWRHVLLRYDAMLDEALHELQGQRRATMEFSGNDNPILAGYLDQKAAKRYGNELGWALRRIQKLQYRVDTLLLGAVPIAYRSRDLGFHTQDSDNIQYLTWLVAFVAPLMLAASVFSINPSILRPKSPFTNTSNVAMTSEVADGSGQYSNTVKFWSIMAIPLEILVIGIFVGFSVPFVGLRIDGVRGRLMRLWN